MLCDMGRDKARDNRHALANIYSRIDVLLHERDLTWSKLATLIGVSQSTMATTKSRNMNIGILTLIKIADVLQVSLDEICQSDGKCPEYFDLCWLIPRALPDQQVQKKACELFCSATERASEDPLSLLQDEDGELHASLEPMEHIDRLERTKKDLARNYEFASKKFLQKKANKGSDKS